MESLKSKISRSYHRWFGMVLLIPGLIFNNCSSNDENQEDIILII